ncbi:hypothetical protein [Asanoa sp. NPDC050611]
MSGPERRPLRRWMPIVLLVAFSVWIVFLVVLIAVDPAGSGGHPFN